MISEIKLKVPTIVTFNGSGFDLHFLVKKLCDIRGFTVERNIK